MTEVKHTEGSWYFDGQSSVCAKALEGSYSPCVASYVAEANAHLIAAAPDMEKALEGLFGALGLDRPDEELIEDFGMLGLDNITRARAALAKARGEEK